jgi:chaperonin GroES
MSIKPLFDRVVIKRMEEEKVSAGGIVIPDSATEKPIKGEVVAVGEGKPLDNGSVRALKVKAGDKVLYGKYGDRPWVHSSPCWKDFKGQEIARI